MYPVVLPLLYWNAPSLQLYVLVFKRRVAVLAHNHRVTIVNNHATLRSIVLLQEWVILNREKVEPLPVSLEAADETHVVVGVVEPGVVGHLLLLVTLPLKDE